MGCACGTHGQKEKTHKEYWWVKPKKTSWKILEKVKTEFIEMGSERHGMDFPVSG